MESRDGSEVNELDFALKHMKVSILDEAKKEAARITKAAEVKIFEINKEALKEMNYWEHEVIPDFKKKKEREFNEAINEIKNQKVKELLEYKQRKLEEAIKALIDEFTKKMKENKDYYYHVILAGIIQSVFDQASFKEYVLRVNGRDDAFLKEHPRFLEKFEKRIKVVHDPTLDGGFGCILEDLGGNIRFNNILSQVSRSHREQLKTKLSPVLFKE